MKKLAILIPTLFFSLLVKSQDIITYTDGEEAKVKVLEVNLTDVKYKKWENLEGPSYSMAIEKIFMIKYQNGTKEVFKKEENHKNETKNVSNKEEHSADKKMVNYLYNQEYEKVLKLKSHYIKQGIGCSIFGALLMIGGITLMQSNSIISPDGNEALIGGAAVSTAGLLIMIRIPIAFSKAAKFNKKAKDLMTTIKLTPAINIGVANNISYGLKIKFAF